MTVNFTSWGSGIIGMCVSGLKKQSKGYFDYLFTMSHAFSYQSHSFCTRLSFKRLRYKWSKTWLWEGLGMRLRGGSYASARSAPALLGGSGGMPPPPGKFRIFNFWDCFWLHGCKSWTTDLLLNLVVVLEARRIKGVTPLSLRAAEAAKHERQSSWLSA